MATEVDIANMALGCIGVTRSIEALDDGSEDAIQCTRWFAIVRDECLKKVPWQFACDVEKLAALENVSSEWKYAYVKPADALRIMVVGPENFLMRQAQSNPRFPFAIIGQTVFSDVMTAFSYYIRRVTDATEFPPEFATWMSWKLSLRIGRSLGADASTMQTAAAEERAAFRDAVVSIQNERNQDTPADPDSIATRWL